MSEIQDEPSGPSDDDDAAVRCEPADAATLSLILSGRWKIDAATPSADEALQQAGSTPGITRIAADTRQVAAWDSTLITFLLKIQDHCTRKGLTFDSGPLPEGIQGLLKLATAVPAREGAGRTAPKETFLARIGVAALRLKGETAEILAFIGEAFLALCRLFTGRARFQRSDLLGFIWNCGPQALPIVTLISLLVGLILAFVGAIQLLMFGAQIYV
nr:ABC transporter permease [Desulfobacterales bacterium]